MTASELKNHNKPNKKPAQTTPPSKTDSVQFYNIIVSFTEQKKTYWGYKKFVLQKLLVPDDFKNSVL